MAKVRRGRTLATQPKAAPAPFPWRVGAAIVAVYLLFQIIFDLLAAAGRFASLQGWTARAADTLLDLFGIRIVLAGVSLVTSRGMVTVEPVCIPTSAMAMSAALLLVALAQPWWYRAASFAAALAALLLVNVARIALVTALMEAGSPLFDPIHEIIFPVALHGLMLIAWAAASELGTRRVVSATPKAARHA